MSWAHITAESRAKIAAASRARKGWHHTEETKAKLRTSNRGVQRGQQASVSTPEARREAHRKRLVRFGLTEETFSALLAAQGGLCAICGSDNGWRELAIDHDHTTGRVRGLLCHPCNLAAGHIERLRAAGLQDRMEDYLR